MKGWRSRGWATVLEFGELPDPVPGAGQVLVRVHAVACNFPDILVCQGRYQEKPELPFTPGMEIAGEVVTVGEGARAAVGDRVLGTPPIGRGGYAELAVQAVVANLWRTGGIDPLVGAELPLVDAPAALRGLGSRGTTGKVVLVP